MQRFIERGFATYKTKVAIIGGGTGGLAVCGQLLRKGIVNAKDMIVLEPNKEHTYCSYTTIVGAGLCGNSDDSVKRYERFHARPIAEVFPKDVKVLPHKANSLDPDHNFITTETGDQINYEIMLLSPGLENNFPSIEGSLQALQNPSSAVGSIYDGFQGACRVNRLRQEITGGVILFSNALPPAKCAGAPLKMCFLLEDYLARTGKRKDTELHYYCTINTLFSIPEYAGVLLEMTRKRGIHVHFGQVLSKIEGDKKVAHFRDAKNGKVTPVKFDFLHFSPHFKAFDVVKNSGLCNQHGLIMVNTETLQHVKYKNVFSLGDGSDIPVNKTAASVTVQAPVVVHNIGRVLKNAELNAKYNGYSVCPVYTGNKKMLFTESLYGYPYKSFFVSNMKPKWFYYFFTLRLMPRFYWRYLPRGRWYGTKFIFSPTF